MTMPSLIAKTKEKEAVSQLKKVHSTLENAFRLAQNEHSEISNWFSGNDRQINAEIFYNNIKPYLKISKDCGFEAGCFTPGKIKTLDGRDYIDYDNYLTEYKIILADGTPVMFYFPAENDYIYGNIKVDINGKNGEYTLGKDVFVFNVTKSGIIPGGKFNEPSAGFEEYCNISKNLNANGLACTAWVIYNENMDYLHCSDLSWDGKKKCK